MANSPRVKNITFRTDKNGKRFATEFFQGRNWRIAVAEAELLLATGRAIEEKVA